MKKIICLVTLQDASAIYQTGEEMIMSDKEADLNVQRGFAKYAEPAIPGLVSSPETVEPAQVTFETEKTVAQETLPLKEIEPKKPVEPELKSEPAIPGLVSSPKSTGKKK